MNLLILLILLLIGVIISLKLCNGDIMDPVPLSFASFLISTFIAFMRNGLDRLDISIYTVLYVITALFTFSFGYVIAKTLLSSSKINQFSPKQVTLKFPKKKWNRIMILVMAVIFYLSIKELILLAATVVSTPDESNTMMAARNATIFNNVNRNYFVTIAAFASTAAGYFYTYLLIINKPQKGYLLKYLLSHFEILIIILISLCTSILGTGRTFLIKYLVFIWVANYYNSYLKHHIKRYSWQQIWKFAKRIVIVVIFFFGCFQLLGLLTGKTGSISAFEMLNAYSGAAMVALDHAFDIYTPDNRFWGEECFYGLYGFLNAIGIHIPNDILHLPFVYFNDGTTTNIYTSLRSYVYDFGFVGMYIVQFILGIISAFLYVGIKQFGRNPVYLIIYALFIYGISMQGIAETTIRNFMSITNIFLVLFFGVFCFLDCVKIKFGRHYLTFHG